MAAQGTHDDLLWQLKQVLESATELSRRLETSLATPPPAPTGAAAGSPEKRLSALEQDREMLTSQLVETERQVGKLMGLYVATYQLHASLDPAEVQRSIAEIARDLLGAELFVLLLKDEQGSACQVALIEGGRDVVGEPYASGVYTGGDPMVDATLADGVLRLAGPGSERPGAPLGVVPLRVEDETVGALVVLKLFDHCHAPLSNDREILDLLAAHAATALFAANICARADRKLKTLESLVQLMRGN